MKFNLKNFLKYFKNKKQIKNNINYEEACFKYNDIYLHCYFKYKFLQNHKDINILTDFKILYIKVSDKIKNKINTEILKEYINNDIEKRMFNICLYDKKSCIIDVKYNLVNYLTSIL